MTRFCFAVLLLCSFLATAHESRPAYLEINEQSIGVLEINWTRPVRDGLALNIHPVFPADCIPWGQISEYQLDGLLHQSWRLDCRASVLAGRVLSISGLNYTISDVLLRFEAPGGDTRTQVLDSSNPQFVFPTESSPIPNLSWYYFELGVEHILEGSDHLLFVLALLLLIQGFWSLIKTITAFTVAHSITLAAAVLGYVHVPSTPVEAVIALSIMFLACELTRPDRDSLSRRLPWLIAAVFGLVHGFGFAGALAEIGLPEGDIPLALFMFNIGVEAGQVLFVLVAVTVLQLVRRFMLESFNKLEFVTSYSIGSLAAFWLIERMTGFY